MTMRQRARRPAQVAATVLGLMGATAETQAADVHYRCADGTMLVARFTPGRVDLTMGRSTLGLPQAASADGGRYVGKDLTFWIKGRGAELTRGARQTQCSVP